MEVAGAREEEAVGVEVLEVEEEVVVVQGVVAAARPQAVVLRLSARDRHRMVPRRDSSGSSTARFSAESCPS